MACSTPRRRMCSCRVRTRWCQSPWTAVRCVSFLLCRVEKLGADALLVKVLGIAGFGRVAAFDNNRGNVKQGQTSPTYRAPFSSRTVPAEPASRRPHTSHLKAQLESQRRDETSKSQLICLEILNCIWASVP
eukprot:scaffold80196_cov67-Phaeocystis_antarctica.AAC.7